MVAVIRERHTSVAAHAVPVVNSQAKPTPTHIAEGAMIYVLLWAIIVEVADVARVFCIGFEMEFAFRVATFVTGRLQGTTSHAKYLCDSIPVQRGVFILGWHFPLLFTAKPTSV
mmetsp:Transcript_10677/g.22375  ORF Transcript_10677/g.22375 Transcript_10677/m.22375 type:complete len:114 (+) Transcript_10677:592-933(+)